VPEPRQLPPGDPDASGSTREDAIRPPTPADEQAAAVSGAPAKPLATSFGTALGAAMLGFEQALRNEPPAEVMAAEHMPSPGQISGDGEVVIEFPEHPEDPGTRVERGTGAVG